MQDILFQLFDKKIFLVLKEVYKKDYVSIREVSRKTGLSVASVFRIFKKIEKLGLLKKKEVVGNKVYVVDKGNKAYVAFKSFLPVANPLDDFISSMDLKDVDKVLLLDSGGSTASIWIVGHINKSAIIETTNSIREKTGFSISAQVFSKEQIENLERLNIHPPVKKMLFKKS
ncbi:MAG TPA: MarR family transcriptional regulator [Bacteroidetes bacterium]|nr:MarR family transcriptional regulator [Bacteroidota bacterium]